MISYIIINIPTDYGLNTIDVTTDYTSLITVNTR